MRTPIRTFVAAVVLVAGSAMAARPQPAAGGATVNLPQMMTDPMGMQWMIYQQGWFQQQGNNPVYSQSAQLNINGNQPSTRNPNRARVEEKTGELLFDFTPQQGVNISRRVLLDKKNGRIRYVEVFKNTKQQDVSLAVQIMANLNYGVNAAEVVTDPRKQDRNLAWVATTDGPACPVEIFASKNAKLTPTLDWQPGNNTVAANYQLTIPAGKSVALLHLHAVAGTSESGVKLVEQMKEAKVVADLPAELRKQLVNFTSSGGLAGDYEVLRGELQDVVELRGGDQYKGMIKEESFKLQTFYGTVELPAERVVGLINVGDFRPRQLLVTVDGEIFGGQLATESINLELSSGQVTKVPLSQVVRVGYRKRAGEPEEWTLAKPMVLLRTGDRVQIDLPAGPLAVSTRYGKLSIDPKAVSSVVLASEEHGVHEILLADGSQFAGLVDADAFEMTLAGGKQAVKFPASALTRIQFAPPAEAELDAPTINLTNGDRLVGELSGDLKLDTSFDTLTINAGQVKKLVHPDPNTLDLQVTLWDDSTLSGQLQTSDVPVKLASGVSLTIPTALVADYTQPMPTPAPGTVEKIKALVAALAADDFAKREQAQSDLATMGPVTVRILREMKGSQSPEAQQRIDALIKQFEQKPGRAGN